MSTKRSEASESTPRNPGCEKEADNFLGELDDDRSPFESARYANMGDETITNVVESYQGSADSKRSPRHQRPPFRIDFCYVSSCYLYVEPESESIRALDWNEYSSALSWVLFI
jgi:hypothetical protein